MAKFHGDQLTELGDLALKENKWQCTNDTSFKAYHGNLKR